MGVKIADKLEQFNNGTYYLVDSSAVEYVDKDGNSQSVKDVLDNGIGEGNTTDLTDIENRITTNEADITALHDTTSNFLKTYTSIEQLGLTIGSETIEDIVNSMEDKTRLITLIFELDNNVSIYPYRNGTLSVEKINIYRVHLKFFEDVSSNVYVSTYHGEKGFTGWRRLCTTSVEDVPNYDLTEINTKLTQLENKANFIPVVADNPTDYDLNNYKENGNYSICDSSKYSNVPINRPALLTVIRSDCYRLQIYTVLNTDDVYFRKSIDWGRTWLSWVLLNNSSGASDNGSSNDVYSTEEQAVGTWINGKTLYRRTIEDNTLRETGNDMIKLFAYNTNMKIVKFEGVVTLANNNGQTVIRSLPYSKDGEEVYITKTTLDTLRLDSYLKNFKLGGYIVSVYYYKV